MHLLQCGLFLVHRSITLFEPPTLRCQLSLQRGQNVSPGKGFPWKLERGVELWKSKSTVAATARWGKAQLVYEYVHLKFLNLARESGGTEDQPEPTPGPNHHPNSIRYILHQERERGVELQSSRTDDRLLLHAFTFRSATLARRQRLNLRPAVSTLGPSLHSIDAFPRRATSVRQSGTQSL
jgi:hypothetical protein